MTPQTERSDGELLRSMLAGDEEALAALFQRRAGEIFRFALQMCGSRALADDVTQEVFMVLIREGHTFDAGRGSVSAFLMGVARNHVLRRLRRERFYVSLDGDSTDDTEAMSSRTGISRTGETPLDDLSRSETIQSVRRSVLALPERYREVIVLCELQEMSYVEAAEILGCAVGTVRSRLHRARALLIEKLRPASEEEAVEVKSARCFA
ncbi:MAG TPA: RNA polymerase sigma factor [Pyrinomonadaceae bacterium]|jgi:RNA polymerase sigma-70 factor (ECF subfamily)|nr:RNA polymerase sigma factor [Pyrinomonadaceae bacterium]